MAYIDSHSVAKELLTTIKEDLSMFHRYKKKWFSPYISLFQSSGYGKSRLLKQLATLCPVLYISFATGRSTFPSKSRLANTIEYHLSSVPSERTRVVIYFMFFIYACWKHLSPWEPIYSVDITNFNDMSILELIESFKKVSQAIVPR